MKKYEIYIGVCHHKKFPYIKSDYIHPIHVGAALSKDTLEYCERDDSGDNISIKNSSWCELTAMYWMWKNIDADYYGLMHYRRYLSFSKKKGEVFFETELEDKEIKKYGLSNNEIKKFCSNYDIITAPYFNIHPVGLPNLIHTSYAFYKAEHRISDLDKVIEITKKRYPHLYNSLMLTLEETRCFWGNIQIMKKEYFFEYCSILFDVLNEAEKRVDISICDAYQKRVWGFVAERLANAYLHYARQKYSQIKLMSTSLLFLTEKPLSPPFLSIEKKDLLSKVDHINLCFSFDDNYLPHADVALSSLIANISKKVSVDCFILCDSKLSMESREKFAKNRPQNICLNYIEVDPKNFSSFPLNRSYISINTYFRLVIHKVLPAHVNKVIYLDSDTLVLGDIQELWNIDMNNYSLAGVHDEGGVSQMRRLGMSISSNYVNAGVLVFNLDRIREKFEDLTSEYIQVFLDRQKLILLQDQDILNLTFEGDISVLPLRWNINSRLFSINTLEKKYNVKDAEFALQNPGIVHFTDHRKPWKLFCSNPFRIDYWKFREESAVCTVSLRDKMVGIISDNFSYELFGSEIELKLFSLQVRLPKRYFRYFKKIIKYISI